MHNKSKLLKDRQNIQDELLKIQSKSISESVITNSDGVITIHMPNAIENIKKSASLKIKLPWIESLLGNHKQGKQNSRLPESSA